jgi:Flp pilus assembly protein TadB
MTASSTRNFLLALGLLVAAFGLISAFTPRGLSWGLMVTGSLLVVPWLVASARDRRRIRSADQPTIPAWHPESEPL